MNLKKLLEKTERAILELEKYSSRFGSTDQIDSIKQQMIFLRENAASGKNPINELGDKKLTYGIIASREFASPDELELKGYLDNVSEVLDEE